MKAFRPGNAGSSVLKTALLLVVGGVCSGLTPLPPEIRLLPESAHPPTTALWLFDEPPDAPARSLLEDWTHHGYDLTLEPGARLISGKFGRALDVLGTGRAAIRRNTDRCALNLGPFDWTWETWLLVKAAAHPGAVLFEMRQGPFESGPVCGLRVGDEPARLTFTCETAGFPPRSLNTDPQMLGAPDEKWRHLALVYEAGAHTLTHYVDGQLVDAITLPAPMKTFEVTGENNLSIGTDIGGWHALPAVFDEMRFSQSIRYRTPFTPPASFAPRREPLTLGLGPHLFIDDSLIAESQSMERVTHQPQRLPEPVIPQRTIRDGWEQQAGGATFLYYPEEGKFRAWMSVKNLGLDQEEFYATTYWESEDGIHWTAPDLGLFEVGGTSHHNVVMTAGRHNFRFHSDSVIDEGPGAPDATRRFKLAYFPFDFSQDNRGMNVAFSPDGVHWTPYEGNPVLYHWDIMKGFPDAPTSVADINDVYYDEALSLYVLAYKTYALPCEYPMAADQRTPRWREVNDVVPGYRRLTGLATSRDFIHWENLQRVMVPDEKDPPELQFYAMNVCKRGDLYIGHVRCLDDQAEGDGIGWMELATSRDLYHWTRHRGVFFDRNPAPDSWDHSICWQDRPVLVGEKLFFFYVGLASGHKTGTRSKGLAILRKDGYVSRRAADAPGLLTTIPMSLPLRPETRLVLNAATFEDGAVRVAVLDDEGRALDGYTTGACQPVQGDGTALPVRWDGRTALATPDDGPIRLRFELQKADIYGFELVTPNPAVDGAGAVHTKAPE